MKMYKYLSKKDKKGVQYYYFKPGVEKIYLKFYPREDIYEYSTKLCSKDEILRMQELAVYGEDLTTYKNQHIGDKYDRKFIEDIEVIENEPILG
jgi:hypothetical protein